MWISPKMFYSIFFLKSFLCCDCNIKHKDNTMNNHGKLDVVSENNGLTTINLDKRQLDFEEEFITETAMGIPTVGATNNDITLADTTVTPKTETNKDNNIQATENNVDDDKLEKCPHYKKSADYDLSMMADVWENAYYQMTRKLSCFRLHLKMVSIQERRNYEMIYGNFNNTVHWDKCMLEVKAGANKNTETKKHFLQGTASDKGVLDNIIIVEVYDDKTTTITLQEENPDQWLIVKDLLLMRDCVDGDIVVFSRVPFQPRHEEVIDALTIFGDFNPNGTFGCVGNDFRNSVLLTESDEFF